MMDNAQSERYSRQILLGNFGVQAQQKLLQSKVLVIGSGGLGCPVLQYLAAAGVGTIGIADGDRVALSNLQRQVIYTVSDIGLYKAHAATAHLRAMNPDLIFNEYLLFVNNENALDIIKHYDYIIDCTDNFKARYLINDACALLNKPLIFGAIYQYEGQVAVFNLADNNGRSINYRHLFPTPPTLAESPDCATAGVLGVLPGLIGVMQASEVIKLITGIGQPLTNKLLSYNMLAHEQVVIDLTSAYGIIDEQPKNETAFLAINYDSFCNAETVGIEQIDSVKFKQLLEDELIAIIDVREPGELPVADFRHVRLPLSIFETGIPNISENQIVVFCRTGNRSQKAAQLLKLHLGADKKVYNLQGGISAL